MKRLVASVLGLVALASAYAAHTADLRDLLRQSQKADQRWSYQGTKVLSRRHDGHETSSTVKCYHRAPDRTLLRAVDGDRAGGGVLQLGRQHFIKMSDGRYCRTPLPPPADNTELMLQNYRLRQMRVEPIAGRKCVMVSIEPRYPGNPRKLVWLDVKTGLPLKTEVYTPGGDIERSIFLNIQFNPRLTAGVFRLPANAIRDESPEVAPDFDIVDVRESGYPPGYRLVETSVRLVPDGHVVAFQRFSDGLNTLTLLESRTHPRLTSLGGRAAVHGKVGRVHFVLCGDQEPEILRHFAQSLQGRPLTIRVNS